MSKVQPTELTIYTRSVLFVTQGKVHESKDLIDSPQPMDRSIPADEISNPWPLIKSFDSLI